LFRTTCAAAEHLVAKLGVSWNEAIMEVHVAVVVGSGAIETIEIQLSAERGKLALIKVNVHDPAHKLLLIVNLKGTAIISPGNNMSEIQFLSIFQQLMKLGREESTFVVQIAALFLWLERMVDDTIHLFLKASL
jgi:hypothetical protein